MKLEARQRLMATTDFRYGLINRPPGIGAVPKGYTHYSEDNERVVGIRHGILTYPHRLSDADVKSYELLPLDGKDGKPLIVPQLPPAVVRKAQEAVDGLNYIKTENLTDVDDAIKEFEDVIDIFRDYVKRKHLDPKAALKELGYEA